MQMSWRQLLAVTAGGMVVEAAAIVTLIRVPPRSRVWVSYLFLVFLVPEGYAFLILL